MNYPKFEDGMTVNEFMRRVDKFKTNQRGKKCFIFFNFLNKAMNIKDKDLEYHSFYKLSGIPEYRLFKNYGNFVKVFIKNVEDFKKRGFLAKNFECNLEELKRDDMIKYLRKICEVIGYRMITKKYIPKDDEEFDNGDKKTPYRYFIFKLI